MQVQEIRNKRVTVAGLGRFGGGIAVARWLVENGAKVLVTDQALAEKLRTLAPDATIIAEHGRELSYFSRRRVIDPLTARRTPPTDAEYAALREKLAAEPWVFVVLPGKKSQELIERFGGEVGDARFSEGDLTVYNVRFTAPRATTQP